jgi:serine/threonine protein kinase
MSLCINPQCPKPDNSDTILFCEACGSELLLKGRYRAMCKLGEGGFGITYEVTKVGSTVPEVLKVLTYDEPKAIELFQQEAKVLSELDHPGIPKVDQDSYFVYHPRGSQVPIHCFVMEKIVGMDLRQYMENLGQRPIDQKLAIEWLKEVVTILGKVHDKNFFHRDIKPPNIMIRSSGELVLIDFGTARKVTTTVLEQKGGVTQVVSEGYTPQEQMVGDAIPQSDFFALGRTFVALLTGKEPLDLYDSFRAEVLWRTHSPEISPLLANLIDEMMAHKPSQRPANTQVILQRLAEIDRKLYSNPVTPPTEPVCPQKTKKISQPVIVKPTKLEISRLFPIVGGLLPVALITSIFGLFVALEPLFWGYSIFTRWDGITGGWNAIKVVLIVLIPNLFWLLIMNEVGEKIISKYWQDIGKMWRNIITVFGVVLAALFTCLFLMEVFIPFFVILNEFNQNSTEHWTGEKWEWGLFFPSDVFFPYPPSRSIVENFLAISVGALIFGCISSLWQIMGGQDIIPLLIHKYGTGKIPRLAKSHGYSDGIKRELNFRYFIVHVFGSLIGSWIIIFTALVLGFTLKSTNDNQCLIIATEGGLILGILQSLALKIKLFNVSFWIVTSIIGVAAFVGYYFSFIVLGSLINPDSVKTVICLFIFLLTVSVPTLYFSDEC